MNETMVREHMHRTLGMLSGGRVVIPIFDIVDDQAYLGLMIQVGEKMYHVWHMRDEEGNGPGYPLVEEL